jgi:hypothetical protein
MGSRPFFPEFPFGLESEIVTQDQCNRMTFPKPFVRFETSPIARAIQRSAERHSHLFAVVFRWPYQRNVTDSIVAHNRVPPDTSRLGVHCCWRLADGTVAVMQDLPSFIATIDKMYPDADWKASALHPNYGESVAT